MYSSESFECFAIQSSKRFRSSGGLFFKMAFSVGKASVSNDN